MGGVGDEGDEGAPMGGRVGGQFEAAQSAVQAWYCSYQASWFFWGNEACKQAGGEKVLTRWLEGVRQAAQ